MVNSTALDIKATHLSLHALLGVGTTPRFAGRSAFRALIPAGQLSPAEREPIVNLWIGPGGHLVHYPVRAGAAVNIVAACGGRWQGSGWNTGVGRNEVLERFPPAAWAAAARQLLAAPAHWQKWPLYDREPLPSWAKGRLTLLGDAAHAMLPHLGQGANQSIEDGMALATILANATRETVPGALLAYERLRREQAAKVQSGARPNGLRYDSFHADLEVRDAEITAHAEFRKRLYDHDVVPEARAAAVELV